NNGDVIRLYNETGILQLSVCFGDSTPWATDADGNGYTLENEDFNGNINEASNWFAGCYGGSPGKVYTSCALSVADKNGLTISLYPNPAATDFNIEIHGASASNVFELYDVQGRKVLVKELKDESITSI